MDQLASEYYRLKNLPTTDKDGLGELVETIRKKDDQIFDYLKRIDHVRRHS